MKVAAIFLILLSSPVFAEKLDTGGPGRSQEWAPLPTAGSGVSSSIQNVGSFGQAKIAISSNESVSFGVEISVSVNCGGKTYRALEPTLRACKFVRSQFDAKNKRLILHFKSTRTVAGREECVETESFDFPLAQHCGK